MENDTSYSVDFSGKPQKVEADPNTPEARKILADSIRVMIKAWLLQDRTKLIMNTVLEWCAKYRKVKPEKMDWQEKEKLQKELETLMSLWKASFKELMELDGEYDGIRKRAAAYYGKNVMPKYERHPHIEKMFNEMFNDLLGDNDAEGEEWKNGE